MSKVVPRSTAKVFFPNLDGLRTIAFFLVYVQHGLWGCFQTIDLNSDFLKKLVFDVANGGTGVSVFFVLSGYLITYLLLLEAEANGKINVVFFYIRRVLRIWPLYFAVVLFGVVVYPYFKTLIGIESNLASNPIYYFTFLSNFDVINVQRFHPGFDAAVISITWSVAIEEQFYLVWPLLFLFTPKPYYKYVFLLVIGISLAFRLLNKSDVNILYFHSLSVCADLAVGGICAYYSLFSKKFKHFFSRLSKTGIVGVYLSGFLWMLYGNDVLNANSYPIFFRLTCTLFFAFIIVEQNFSANSFYKFSKNKILTYWGKYTYGLYLLHPIALLVLDVAIRIFEVPNRNGFLVLLLVGIAGLLLSLLLSYLSYEYFEKKFLNLKEKFSFINKQTTVIQKNNNPVKQRKVSALN